MLKKRNLQEVPTLFELSIHPDVYPYMRHKAKTIDEYYFLTKYLIEAEENGALISRTIIGEYEQPIGTISLYDIENKSGFLATWIGQPFFGRGYNKLAKQLFLEELFFTLDIETVFMKVRKTNMRSLKAVSKLPYVLNGIDLYASIYEKINQNEEIYDLYVITKEHYVTYVQFAQMANKDKEEVVS